MNRPVIIFSDLLPPKRGGLADHTFRLAQELSPHHSVTVISSLGVATDAPFAVRPVMDDWRDLPRLRAELATLPAEALLLWQYVPHMYGRGGVNRALPRFMRELHEAGRSQVVLAHEIAADYSWHPARSWYTWNQRRQWEEILQFADVIPVGCGRWVEDWSRRRPAAAAKLFVLPSPSNLPLEPVAPDQRSRWRRELGWEPDTRVLGYFGTLDPSKQLPWILDAWAAAHTPEHPVALALIGSAPAITVPEDRRRYFRALGHLAAPEASRALSSLDVLALPFIDGISERRGSLMAGLQHGVPVVSTIGHNTGSHLQQAEWLALTPVSDRAAFVRTVGQLLADPQARRRIGAAAQTQYHQNYSWSVVVDRLRQRFPR